MSSDQGYPSKVRAGANSLNFIAILSIAIGIVLLLSYRMTLGVDLSDESYYLSFLDGWLKTGVRDGNALVLHQTAELLVFPFVKAFAFVNGGVEGLALFNRFLYLSISSLAGFCFYRFSRTREGASVAILSGLFVMSFIPFSLPSPSYNTLGMLGITCALSAFGTYAADLQIRWLLISAASWMICIVAYPTLVIVLALLLLFTATKAVPKQVFWRYAVACFAFQLIGVAILVLVYGIQRLEDIVAFTNASLQVSSGLFAKFERAASLIGASKIFILLCVASVLSGVYAAWSNHQARTRWVAAAAILVTLIAARSIGPVLYATTHDFVFLLALTGFGYFTCIGMYPLEDRDRIVRGMFFIAFVAGLITSITATNSAVNFAIGGFYCAPTLTLAIFDKSHRSVRPHLALLGLTIALFVSSAFSFIYGERVTLLSSSAVNRVEHGVYAGLLTSTSTARSISRTMSYMAQLPGDSIAVVGRLPGIYLLTRLKPKTISTWDFGQQNGTLPKVDGAISAFYAVKTNRPSVVVQTTDPWTAPPAPSGLELLSSYKHFSRLETEDWTLDSLIPQDASIGAK